jgi:AmmeMemoRadiSam system protein A
MSELTQQQREFLLQIARQAVAAAAGGETPPDVETLAAAANLPLDGTLGQNRGVFVTLTSDGHLRGCIGYIEGFKPLAQAVADNGRSAAVADPRFQPVQPHEVKNLEVEISALTPLIEVNSHKDIQVGKHGVLLEKNGRQAVFLPQVATEQGWDLPTTLTHLALKAGLGPDQWRQGAVFRVFEAEVF